MVIQGYTKGYMFYEGTYEGIYGTKGYWVIRDDGIYMCGYRVMIQGYKFIKEYCVIYIRL